MSQESVEITRRAFEQWQEGGGKAAIADSDVALERDVFQVWTLRDGLVVKWRVFETREQALEAVGLSEQDAQH